MTIDEKIQNRLVELLKQGDAVLATRRSPPANVIGPDSIDHQLAFQWSTSAQSLLTRVFGPDSQHYKNFTLHVGKDWLGFSDAYRAQGVLKAAQDDYASGQLSRFGNLWKLRSSMTSSNRPNTSSVPATISPQGSSRAASWKMGYANYAASAAFPSLTVRSWTR